MRTIKGWSRSLGLPAPARRSEPPETDVRPERPPNQFKAKGIKHVSPPQRLKPRLATRLIAALKRCATQRHIAAASRLPANRKGFPVSSHFSLDRMMSVQ